MSPHPRRTRSVWLPLSLFFGFFFFSGSRLPRGPYLALSSVAAQSAQAARTDAARLLGIPATQVLDTSSYPIVGLPTVESAVLVRYIDKNPAWAFPALVMYYPCHNNQRCISLLRLGEAADRLGTLGLIDAQAPVQAVPQLVPHFFPTPLHLATSRPQGPLLLIVAEHQEKSGANARPGALRQVLHLVSIQHPEAPSSLGRLSLKELWGESADRRDPPPRSVGHSLVSLSIGRDGPDVVLLASERELSSRFSKCLPPKPRRIRMRLVQHHFVALPGTEDDLSGCR